MRANYNRFQRLHWFYGHPTVPVETMCVSGKTLGHNARTALVLLQGPPRVEESYAPHLGQAETLGKLIVGCISASRPLDSTKR